MIPSPPPLGSTFTMLEGRKDLDTCQYGYKLAGSSYGLDTAYGEFDIDEKKMSLRFPYADGSRRDGVGDLLEVGGIRTDRHIKNPIVLFDHGKQVQLPIGKAEDPNTGAYTVELDPVGRKAWLTCFFYQGKGLPGAKPHDEYDHALFCEQLFDLAAKRYIRAGSIGYQVVKALKLPADYEQGTPPGLHLLVTLMLEGSLVVLPANGDTVRKALALPQVCGKALSPVLVKSLSPYAEPTKAMANGIGEKGIVYRFEGWTVEEVPNHFKPNTSQYVVRDEGAMAGLPSYDTLEAAKRAIVEEGIKPKYKPGEIKKPSKAPPRNAIEREIRAGREVPDWVYEFYPDLKKAMPASSFTQEQLAKSIPSGVNAKFVINLMVSSGRVSNWIEEQVCRALGLPEHDLTQFGRALGRANDSQVEKAYSIIANSEFADRYPAMFPKNKSHTSSFSQENGKMESGAASKEIKSIRAKYKRKGLDNWRDISTTELDQEYKEGYEAGKSGGAQSSNPNGSPNTMPHEDNRLAAAWDKGWRDGSSGKPSKVKSYETSKSLSSIRRKYMRKAQETQTKALEGYATTWDVTGYGPKIPGNKYGNREGFKTVRVMALNKSDALELAITILPENRREAPTIKEIVKTSIANWDGPKAHNVKSLNVRYRSKVIKGFAEVQVKFALPDRDRTKQAAMFAEMEASGYGRPQGVRWSEDGKDLASTAENVSYKFCLEPGKSLPAELEKLSTIAAKHGARLVGNTKS